jgi:putative ABC transport system permease protein
MSPSQHLRVAFRQWARQPRLTATVVVTLALGIGGATTMYAVLKAISRFGQPTVPEPEQVGRLFTTLAQQPDGRGPVSLTDYHRWQQAVPSIETLAAYTQGTRLLRTADGGDEVDVLSVTPSYLTLLETPPLLGRYFTLEESRASDRGLAVLSEKAWRSRFGADTAVLGRVLDLDGRSHTVVGVVAERLGLVMPSTDIFVPLLEEEAGDAVRVIVRRHLGSPWAQVQAQISAAGVRDGTMPLRARVVPILEDAGYRTRMGFLLLVGPAVLVLLIGCGNVASLLLVRAVQREREMAIRLALGASRRHLALQLLVEGWTMAAAGGALGLALSTLGLRSVRALIPSALDLHPGIDAGVVLFAGVAVLLAPLVFGAAPLLHGLRVDLSGALRAGLRKPLFGLRRYHLRDAFAIIEVSLAIGLVMHTFMLLSLFAALRDVRGNFDDRGLVAVRLSAPPPAKAGEARGEPSLASSAVLAESVAAVPGVARVAVGDLPPGGTAVRVSRPPSGPETAARLARVDGRYFETLRLPILRGRGIEDRDGQGTPFVGVVSDSLAKRLWPGEDPLGQHLRVSASGSTESLTVVGVCRDVISLDRLQHLQAPRLDAFRFGLFRPWSQAPGPAPSIVARVKGRPASLFSPIDTAVRRADPQVRLQKLEAVQPTADLVGEDIREGTPWPIVLILAFAGLALLLAVVGVFGVMRQSVDERQAELGVRLALGASSRDVVRLVVEDGLIRVGLGAGVAIAGVGAIARLGFSGLLTLCAADLRLWVTVLGAISLTAVAACYLPARRAARVDPAVTLRSE